MPHWGSIRKPLSSDWPRVPISLHCWQGDDVGGFEKAGRGAGRRIGRHGQLPRQGPHARRTARRRGQGPLAHSRQAPLQPARLLRRDGRQAGRAQRARPRAFPGLDRLGQGAGIGHGLQPHLLRPSQGGRRLDAGPSRRGHPQVLDRARHRLPQDRRGDRRGPGHALRDQRLDSRRHEGPARRPRRPAAAADRGRSTRSSPCRSIGPTTSTPSRAKLFGIGSESYVVGSHEFYLGYAITRKKLLCLDAGHFHPTETIADKISAVFAQLDEILLHVSRGIRWDSDHVVILDDDAAGHRPGAGPRRFPRPRRTSAWTTSTPASTAWRPG